jgi:hypothetical protein
MRKRQEKFDMNKYPTRLRGPANNRHGGHQMRYERGLRGNTYGAASTGRIYSTEERQAWAVENGYPKK